MNFVTNKDLSKLLECFHLSNLKIRQNPVVNSCEFHNLTQLHPLVSFRGFS